MRGGGHRQRAKGHLSGRRVCHLIFQRFIIQIISDVRSFQTALIISNVTSDSCVSMYALRFLALMA